MHASLLSALPPPLHDSGPSLAKGATHCGSEYVHLETMKKIPQYMPRRKFEHRISVNTSKLP